MLLHLLDYPLGGFLGIRSLLADRVQYKLTARDEPPLFLSRNPRVEIAGEASDNEDGVHLYFLPQQRLHHI